MSVFEDTSNGNCVWANVSPVLANIDFSKYEIYALLRWRGKSTWHSSLQPQKAGLAELSAQSPAFVTLPGASAGSVLIPLFGGGQEVGEK